MLSLFRQLRLFIAFAAFAVVGGAARAQSTETDIRFFEAKVRPLLVEHCFRCHSKEAEKEKKLRGDLLLDSRAGLLKGGETGTAIVPGKPDQSLLLKALRHEGELKMPPTGKWKDQQIADVATWIKAGAPWPASGNATNAVEASPSDPANASNHWSYRPAREPTLPAVRDVDWVLSPIDRFILAKLEAKHLTPAPAADRRTIIRRATFDLLGLPPTPEEVDAFLADSSANAYSKLIDRLLASPAYGERWGRHWLDVARYADSNGMDENLSHANAWRYRDWVIRAFNADMPFDRFIRMQLAGDLLAGAGFDERNDGAIATGFLTIGPKMLAEDDPVKMQMDIIDEQLDTLGHAFMGLTLGCARCHDHKFDPFPTSDYYALAGIFKSTKSMEHYRVVAAWNETSLARKEEQERLKEHDVRIAAANQKVALRDGPARGLVISSAVFSERERLKRDVEKLQKERPQLPMAMAVVESKPENLRVHKRGSHLTLGAETPRGFPQALSMTGQPRIDIAQSGRRQLAEWMTRPEHPLTARVAVNRIWLWHFGEGLVRTPDNFGRLGDIPVHAELLDYLTTHFVRSGWSMKEMHRLIMKSSTYMMSTAANSEAALRDPDNRLHWRWNRQRLDAESLRDSLLSLSGKIDRTVGGSLLTVPNRAYVTGTGSRNYDNYDNSRRSVYLPVIRSAVYDPFQAFDFPDPSVVAGKRAVTTVAPQALLLMNSKLVQQQTRGIAERLLNRADLDDSGRVAWAYELVYSRTASPTDVQRSLAFVERYREAAAAEGLAVAEARVRAWQALCRTLVSSNEFIYVE